VRQIEPGLMIAHMLNLPIALSRRRANRLRCELARWIARYLYSLARRNTPTTLEDPDRTGTSNSVFATAVAGFRGLSKIKTRRSK